MTKSPMNDVSESHPELLQLVEQLTDLLREGNQEEFDRLLAAHPEHADALNSVLPSIRLLHDCDTSRTGSIGTFSGISADDPNSSLRGRLGDFQIIREIGRGGMGVVYEAEQLLLGRHVALKVLPYAAILDERQRTRFQNEARAAATLMHPHVVPVYSVGVERGIHYYAMQYIEGQSLASLVHSLRSQTVPEPPSSSGQDAKPHDETRRSPQAQISTERSTSRKDYFRSVARMGIQVAVALHHAHERGIIHRDIKPGNILLDEAGSAMVTDFGLAHVDNNVTLTSSNDVIGTLRYAPPEQVLGKQAIIDQRADVYSLGATLFELLTLRPANDAADRESLLQQVTFGKPPKLRALDATIPVDLETIVHKALETRPEDRYLTAEEMADDLKRFLEDKPIHAKPATLLQRGAKWSRRHVAVVWSLVLVFLTASVLMGIATAAVMRERSRTTAALERAQTSAQLAKDAVDDMYVNFAKEWIGNQLGLSETERSFLEKAADFYAQVPVDLDASPAVQVSAAKTLRRLSETQRKLGQSDEATDAIHRAISTLEALHAKSPASGTFRSRMELADCYLSLNEIEGPPQPNVVDSVHRAMQAFEQLAAERPDDSRLSYHLANAKSSLALHHHRLQEYDEADRLYAEAHSQLQQLVESSPDDLSLLQALSRNTARRALSCLILPSANMRDGRRGEAQRRFLLGIELADRLAEKSRGNPRHQYTAAEVRVNAIYFVNTNEAIKLLRESAEQLSALFKLDPARSSLKEPLRIVYDQLFDLLDAGKRHEEAVEVMKLRIALRDERRPSDYSKLASSLSEGEHWQEARDAIDKAIRLERKAVEAGAPAVQLARDLKCLADSCRQLGDQEAATAAELERKALINGRIAELTQIIERDPSSEEHFERACLFEQVDHQEKALADYATSIKYDPGDRTAYVMHANTLLKMYRYEEALESIQNAFNYHTRDNYLYAMRGTLLGKLDHNREALRDFNALIERSWRDRDRAMSNVVFLLTCGSPKVRDPNRALELAKQLLEVRRDFRSLQSVGFAYYRLGRYGEARDAFQEAIEYGHSPDDEPEWTWIVFAMTKGQLGDEQEARELFWKAVELFSDKASKENGGNARYTRIIHEAANLLEIDLSATMWAAAPPRHVDLQLGDDNGAPRLVCRQFGTAMSFITKDAIWSFLDDGSDQGIRWRDRDFDDSLWNVGPAQLGYGDGDEKTTVSFGADAENKYRTTYFRHRFTVPEPDEIDMLLLHLVRDDGAAVYLNGQEILREGLSPDATFHSFADYAVSGELESHIHVRQVDPKLLVAGSNCIAAEIHQFDAKSSDLSFDLRLGSVPYAEVLVDQLIGEGERQIPAGAKVMFAELHVWSEEPTSTRELLCRGNGQWEAAPLVAQGTSSTNNAGDFVFNVRDSVQRWSEGAPNRGWVLWCPSGSPSDHEGTYRLGLNLTYIPPDDSDQSIGNDVDGEAKG